MRKKRSFSFIEFLACLCIIFLLSGIFALYFQTTLRIAREVALQNELLNIRMSIEHYRIIYAKLPLSLEELANKDLTSGYPYANIGIRKFLNPIRIDKEGFLIDPFLNRYIYNPMTGKVHTPSEGYQNW